MERSEGVRGRASRLPGLPVTASQQASKPVSQVEALVDASRQCGYKLSLRQRYASIKGLCRRWRHPQVGQPGAWKLFNSRIPTLVNGVTSWASIFWETFWGCCLALIPTAILPRLSDVYLHLAELRIASMSSLARHLPVRPPTGSSHQGPTTKGPNLRDVWHRSTMHEHVPCQWGMERSVLFYRLSEGALLGGSAGTLTACRRICRLAHSGCSLLPSFETMKGGFGGESMGLSLAIRLVVARQIGTASQPKVRQSNELKHFFLLCSTYLAHSGQAVWWNDTANRAARRCHVEERRSRADDIQGGHEQEALRFWVQLWGEAQQVLTP